MIEMVCDLFRSYGYLDIEVEGGYLFSSDETGPKTEFWLVIQENDLSSINKSQAELFDACKKVTNKPSLDKNISMLVLWNTGGNVKIEEMKKKVMQVEEDTYFFKKNVLYFSFQEHTSLKDIMATETIHAFLQKHIALQDVFVEYKKNPLIHQWQSLLYRIAIRIPFIDIKIGTSDGIESLFEKNQNKIGASQDKNLANFDKLFFELRDSDLSSEEYLAKILPILEGNSDGNNT